MTCSSDPCVQFTDVCVQRRGRTILQEVSFRISCGEFLVVLGPNGAGKTTMLRLMNALILPSRGMVQVLGTTTTYLNGYRLRKSIGYVPQVDTIDPKLPLTVRESVAMGRFGRRGLLRKLTTRDWEKVDAALHWVGMTEMALQPLGAISGGEYQRVAIARVLAQEPALFLFDEPTASIDPKAQKEILRLIEQVHDETKATTVYVTHDVNNLPKRCDRFIFLKSGTIWRADNSQSLPINGLFEELYAAE